MLVQLKQSQAMQLTSTGQAGGGGAHQFVRVRLWLHVRRQVRLQRRLHPCRNPLPRRLRVDRGDDRLAVPAVRLDAAQTPLRRTLRPGRRAMWVGGQAHVWICGLVERAISQIPVSPERNTTGTPSSAAQCACERYSGKSRPLSVILFHRVVLVCDSGLFGCEAGPW